ncbi:hypothetical protein ACFQE6_06045, partial [Natrinema soli]
MTVEGIERRSDNGTVLEPLSRPVTVRHRDGIHFESEDGEPRVVADARSAVGRVNVVSHAHA